MDYPLCCQTVTVYRKAEDRILRRVEENCWYEYEDRLVQGGDRQTYERRFLLVQPGTALLLPGDRIYDGIGPQITLEDWDRFLPETVPGLSQVQYAKPWYLEGQICHYEAGRK